MKNLKRMVSVVLMTCILVTPTLGYANNSQSANDLSINQKSTEKKIQPRSVVNPSFYEHKSKTKYLTVRELDNIADYALKFKDADNFSNYMGIASYITGFFPELALFSIGAGTFSFAKSDINTDQIIGVVYAQQRAMRDTHWTTRNTGFHFKRFYNGHTSTMGEWYLAYIYDATNY